MNINVHSLIILGICATRVFKLHYAFDFLVILAIPFFVARFSIKILLFSFTLSALFT